MTTHVPTSEAMPVAAVPITGPASETGIPATAAGMRPPSVDLQSQETIGGDPHGHDRPFSKLKVGDTHRGTVIELIHGSNESFIVYEASGRLSFEAAESVTHRRAAEAMANEVVATAELELQGGYTSTVRALLGRALARAFSANDLSEVAPAFSGVYLYIRANAPVQRVFARALDFIVFLDHQGHVRWEYTKLPNELLSVIGEFERLNAIAANSLADGQDVALRQILGHELGIAFRARESVLPATQVFAASREFVASYLGASVSNLYIVANVATAGILGVCASLFIAMPPLWLSKDARALAIGAMAGMIGACISVLQRSSSLTTTNFASHAQIVSQAVVRMALGSLFGTLMVIAVKGDVALGAFKTEARALFLLAVAAGFSERLIPDLLDNLAKSSGKPSGPPSSAESIGKGGSKQ